MSRNRKDGRARGGHAKQNNGDIESRRCPLTYNLPKWAKGYAKDVSHKWERRVLAKRIIREQVEDAA